VAVGTETVVGAAAGGWTAGSDFSPHPAIRAATIAATATSGRVVRPTAFRSALTGGHGNAGVTRLPRGERTVPASERA
jgi:hypothetical protein